MKKLMISALALMLMSSLWAADQRIETLVATDATVSGEGAAGTEVDSDADNYSIRYFDRLGSASWLSWGVGVERTELSDTDGGAYNLVGLLKAELGPPRFGLQVTGGFGMSLSDVQVVSQEIVVPEAAPALEESSSPVAVETPAQEAGGMWHLDAGLRGAFTSSDRMGWLLAYSLSGSTGEGFTLDENKGVVFALTIPVEGQ